MKKISLILIAFCIVLMFSACSGDETDKPVSSGDGNFFSFFEDEKTTAFAEGFTAAPPVSVTYTFNGEASGEPVKSDDSAVIAALFEVMSGMTVAEESNVYTTDSETLISFMLADGSTVSFTFNGDNLDYNGKVYTLENSAAFRSFLHDNFVVTD